MNLSQKKYASYFVYALAMAIFIAIFRGWFDIIYVTFFIGCMIGVYLPDIDQLIYTYGIKPNDPTSRQAARMIREGDLGGAMSRVQSLDPRLHHFVFHTVSFQLVFTVFAFWVVSSGGSPFGTGIVLGFMLHLLLEQFYDLNKYENLDKWFVNIRVKLDKNKTAMYWMMNLVLLLVFGFLF